MYSVLIISSLDPSGGAGIVADIQCYTRLGIHTYVACSMSTAQNFSGYINDSSTNNFMAQLESLKAEKPPTTIKIGLIAPEHIPIVLTLIDYYKEDKSNSHKPKIVIDPVLSSSMGNKPAINIGALQRLISQSYLAIPNINELEQLGGVKHLLASGCNSILSTGGRKGYNTLYQMGSNADDDSSKNGITETNYPYNVMAGNFHGTGCTLSAYISAYLTLGYSLANACELGNKKTQLSLNHATKMSKMRLPNRVMQIS